MLGSLLRIHYLNAVFNTANNIAYSALTALVTKNSKERVQMGSFQIHLCIYYKLFIQTITVSAVDVLGGGAVGWRNIAIIYCILGVITNTLAVFSVKELPEEELKSRMSEVRNRMYAAGAHYVVDSIKELPALIECINARMANE